MELGEDVGHGCCGVSGRVNVDVDVDVDVDVLLYTKSEARVGDKKECGELPWLTAFLTRFYIALHGVF